MNEDALYKLALRLVTFPGNASIEKPRLLVGGIPERFPVPLPLPEECNILGSLIRDPKSLQIVLDVPLPAKDVHAFYRRELIAQGWKPSEEESGFRRGGFTHTMVGTSNQSYIHASAWNLSVQTMGEMDSVTDTILLLNQYERPVALQRRRRYRPDIFHIFPPLEPPAGAFQKGNGGSSGGDSVHSRRL